MHTRATTTTTRMHHPTNQQQYKALCTPLHRPSPPHNTLTRAHMRVITHIYPTPHSPQYVHTCRATARHATLDHTHLSRYSPPPDIFLGRGVLCARTSELLGPGANECLCPAVEPTGKGIADVEPSGAVAASPVLCGASSGVSMDAPRVGHTIGRGGLPGWNSNGMFYEYMWGVALYGAVRVGAV